MREVHFRITDKCNLKCRHCCYSCGPDGKSISPEGLEKVIDNIPEEIESIAISGGEPLVERNLLMHALECIQEKNKARDNKIKVRIITNGFWARNEESAYRTIRELYDNGVSVIDIASGDRYHYEQGINPELLKPYQKESPMCKAREQLEKEMGTGRKLEIEFRRHYGEGIFAIPFGRAKSLPAKEKDLNRICSITPKLDEITVNPDGKVYPCCWAITPSIGNALEDNLDAVIKRAMRNRVFKTLAAEGPIGVAKLTGYFRRSDEPLYRRQQCVMCEEVFDEMRKNGDI
ncbi:MAG: radical SAM protein [Candidatus Nanoarchaeia archaeon]|nr:radical SAM protein [Candidatus Nanoarchaeia archaeon]